MNKREITCTRCPMGCFLSVEMDDTKVLNVSGNTCIRGEEYGKKECTNPTRIVTSTIPVIGGAINVVPVKTDKDIPKDKIFELIKLLKNVKVNAPIKIGDVIYKNILGTDANIVATRNINSNN